MKETKMNKKQKFKKLTEVKLKLIDHSKELRKKLNPKMSDAQLVETPEFKKWITVNSIIDGLERNLVEDSGFNNILLYLLNESNNDIDEFVSFYEIETEKGEQGKHTFRLVVKDEKK